MLTQHIISNSVECEYKGVHKHTCTPTNQSPSSSCTPMLLLCTDVAHQDHLSHAPHKGLYYACTVQLLGIKTCVNNHAVILGDGTNLCLQVETGMITTDEGRHENGADTYYSVFPLVSGSVNHSIPLYTNS